MILGSFARWQHLQWFLNLAVKFRPKLGHNPHCTFCTDEFALLWNSPGGSTLQWAQILLSFYTVCTGRGLLCGTITSCSKHRLTLVLDVADNPLHVYHLSDRCYRMLRLFLSRVSILTRVIDSKSVRLSVRPSVMFRYCMKPA